MQSDGDEQSSLPNASEFEDHAKKVTVVEARRFKMERYLMYAVILIAGTGILVAAVNPSIFQTIISWFSPSGGHTPTIVRLQALSGNMLSMNSSQAYPTFNNSYVRFNVSYNDTDSTDWYTLVICNGTPLNYTMKITNLDLSFNCTGESKLCVYSYSFVTDNPLQCDMSAAGFANQTQNFTAYIIDSGAKVTNRSGTFAVDRPPKIINISLVLI